MNDLELRGFFNRIPPVLTLLFLCTFGLVIHLLLGMWDGFRFWRREVKLLVIMMRERE
jgi:hypothetical protein